MRRPRARRRSGTARLARALRHRPRDIGVTGTRCSCPAIGCRGRTRLLRRRLRGGPEIVSRQGDRGSDLGRRAYRLGSETAVEVVDRIRSLAVSVVNHRARRVGVGAARSAALGGRRGMHPLLRGGRLRRPIRIQAGASPPVLERLKAGRDRSTSRERECRSRPGSVARKPLKVATSPLRAMSMLPGDPSLWPGCRQ